VRRSDDLAPAHHWVQTVRRDANGPVISTCEPGAEQQAEQQRRRARVCNCDRRRPDPQLLGSDADSGVNLLA
jgi:hypothetical protein